MTHLDKVTSNSTTAGDTGIGCSEGFYMEFGFCFPECGEWEAFPHGYVISMDVAMMLVCVIHIISAIVIFVVSVIDRKRM